MTERSSPDIALANKLDAIFDRITVSCDWRLSYALRAQAARALDREAIARIIQPARSEDYTDDPKLSALIKEAEEDALTKADAILALCSPDAAQYQKVPDGFVLVPRELTAENGAKSALIGEFSETFDYMDDEGDECQAEIPVSWMTIKEIHKKMVKLFALADTSTHGAPSDAQFSADLADDAAMTRRGRK